MSDHNLALTAQAKPRNITLTLTDITNFNNTTDPRRIENVMVWVDGVLISQYYSTPFVRTLITPQTVQYIIPLTNQFDDGPHQIVLGCFQNDTNDAGYITTNILIPPANIPAVKPGTIPRLAFHADPNTLQTYNWIDIYKSLGFNCVQSGIFRNPADNDTIKTYNQWQDWSLGWLKSNLDWCRANDLLFWGTGDDFLRSQSELNWLQTCPWAEQAARATFALARDYPEFIAISMLDETPGSPTDNPVYTKLVEWCRDEYGPKISWPNQRSTQTDPWEAPNIADFADRYYALGVHTWRNGLPQQGTGWQYALEIQNNLVQTRPNQSVAFEVGICSYFYTKLTANSNYSPGDQLKAVGVTPNTAVLGVWLPLAYGVSALRCYALDTFWASQRQTDPIGSEEQTGLQFGTPNATALGSALNAVARYEGTLLGGYRTPWQIGTWVVGRRSSGFQFWINTADTAQHAPVCIGREIITPTGSVPYTGQIIDPGCVLIIG